MQFHRTQSNGGNSKAEINKKPEEVEKKLISRFPFLQQEAGLHDLFSSYDFRENERNMVEVWNKILDYIINEVFGSFAISMSNLKKYTLIKGRIPVGLNNIIQQLRIEGKFITEEDLKSDSFYKTFFPDLYPQEQKGYFSGFMSGLKSVLNFAGGKMGCKEENDANIEKHLRTDISDSDKYKIIPEYSLIFHYENFRNHCNQILSILIEVLQDKEEEIISTNAFKKIINENYLKNDGDDEIGERIILSYGLEYIDYVLYYLMKIKKIGLFATLLSNIESKEKKIEEYSKKIAAITLKAKAKLQKGEKDGARIILNDKVRVLKDLEKCQNVKAALEQQLSNYRNSKSNKFDFELLKQSKDVGKEHEVNIDELSDIISDTKEQKEDIEEVDNMISVIPKFAIAVVETLPVSDISTTTVYLVPNNSGETSNLYDEDIYTTQWEKLGTQTVDLSDYPTTSEMNAAIDAAINSIIDGDEVEF